MASVRVKRVYEPPSPDDGVRILVDRLWPRGLSKDRAAVDHWARDLAPSTALRKWFGHDPGKWAAFRDKYFAELEAKPEAVVEFKRQVEDGPVTLLFGTKDEVHNNAVALREYLQQRG